MDIKLKIRACKAYLRRLEAEQKRQEEMSRAKFLAKKRRLRQLLIEKRLTRIFFYDPF